MWSADGRAEKRCRRGRACRVLLVCVVILASQPRDVVPGTPRSLAQAEAGVRLDDLKVGYVLHFLELTQWPQEGGSLDFCVLGNSSAGDRMLETLRGRRIRDMQIRTQRIARDDPEAESCKAIYIPETSAADVPRMLARLENTPTLTISDVQNFAAQGGVIGFVVVGDRLRFDISERAATKKKLKISARLLELAYGVIR